MKRFVCIVLVCMLCVCSFGGCSVSYSTVGSLSESSAMIGSHLSNNLSIVVDSKLKSSELDIDTNNLLMTFENNDTMILSKSVDVVYGKVFISISLIYTAVEKSQVDDIVKFISVIINGEYEEDIVSSPNIVLLTNALDNDSSTEITVSHGELTYNVDFNQTGNITTITVSSSCDI